MNNKYLAVNPYLPQWEFVPDGEPHVFENRLYIFGSHDRKDGTMFCEEDYVAWSAPVEDLSDWRCDGIIYEKTQDPMNTDGSHLLFAPDVAQGPDGRYYLYYSLDFTSIISVAVCDTPAGRYQFHGYVSYPDGSFPKGSRMFDPAILCEGNGNYLYYGFCPTWRFPGMEETPFPGAMLVELEDDMHTIKTDPICIADSAECIHETSFREHPFFEASSIRHINDTYYFVYSSLQSHELCYATSDSPKGPFQYRGVIVSNGDIGYKGSTTPVNYMGNNHGGIEYVNGEYYIFYHRHTHGTQFSRQGCAEKITILKDGSIPQVKMTSCGLSDEPLPDNTKYNAGILCHLTGPKQDDVIMVGEKGHSNELPENAPYITDEYSENEDHNYLSYVTNLRSGAIWGCKYLRFSSEKKYHLELTLRGNAGTIDICIDSPDNKITHVSVAENCIWSSSSCELPAISGVHAVYFVFHCTEKQHSMDFSDFIFKTLV